MKGEPTNSMDKKKSKSESLILQAKLTVQEEIQLWREDRVSS